MARNLQVIVVDQDVENRRELQKMLALAGLAVVATAGYGVEAYGLSRQLQPDVVLMRLDEPATRPLETLARLSENIPDLPIVVFSSQANMKLMRQAMLSGAHDFLLAPLKTSEVMASMQEVVARSERKKARMEGDIDEPQKHGTVITVFGAKGGIGKTTISTNLACALASNTNSSVALVDMDTRFGDVAITMDLQVERSIADLARTIDTVEREQIGEYLIHHQTGVNILPAPTRPSEWRSMGPEHVNKVINALASTHDFVILDTPGTFNELVAAAIEAGSVILLVTTMEMASIKDTVLSLEMLNDRFRDDPDKVKVVVNRYNETTGIKDRDLEKTLASRVFWRIPHDPEVVRSAQVGRPIVTMNTKARAASSIVQMGLSIAGVQVVPAAKQSKSWFTNLLRKSA